MLSNAGCIYGMSLIYRNLNFATKVGASERVVVGALLKDFEKTKLLYGDNRSLQALGKIK